MISVAQLILRRNEAGASVLQEFAQLPAWQMEIWWNDLAPHCPSSIQPELIRRRANALNVEIGEPSRRCGLLSPDGRGMRWIASGGDALAYGLCAKRGCPRTKLEEMGI